MADRLTDILPLALLLLCVWGLKPVKPLSAFNEAYLSIETTRAYRGIFAIVVIFNHLALQGGGGLLFPQFAKVGYLAQGLFINGLHLLFGAILRRNKK